MLVINQDHMLATDMLNAYFTLSKDLGYPVEAIHIVDGSQGDQAVVQAIKDTGVDKPGETSNNLLVMVYAHGASTSQAQFAHGVPAPGAHTTQQDPEAIYSMLLGPVNDKDGNVIKRGQRTDAEILDETELRDAVNSAINVPNHQGHAYVVLPGCESGGALQVPATSP